MGIDERAYWIWLQHAFGPGSPKPAYLGKRCRDLAAFYGDGHKRWAELTFISEKELLALQGFTPQQAEAQLEYAEKVGQEVVAWCDDAYPQPLKNLDEPPAVLYIKGQLPGFEEALAIAVVGSREADEQAVKTAELFSYELSKAGAVVVSGGALGIDGAAHRGAMRGTAPTVGVLACGIDFPYLMQNQILRDRIVDKGGALVTEYPPGTGVNKGTFSVRNRIISGLSRGLLVVCGKEKSGTMLTVAHATRQNKDIFAVPGGLSDPLAEGPNLLIRDGAKPVLCARDILEDYGDFYTRRAVLEKSGPVRKQPGMPAALSQNAKLVAGILEQEPLHLSVFMARTGLRASQIQAAATELELLGYLKSYSGQRYGLNTN